MEGAHCAELAVLVGGSAGALLPRVCSSHFTLRCARLLVAGASDAAALNPRDQGANALPGERKVQFGIGRNSYIEGAHATGWQVVTKRTSRGLQCSVLRSICKAGPVEKNRIPARYSSPEQATLGLTCGQQIPMPFFRIKQLQTPRATKNLFLFFVVTGNEQIDWGDLLV